MVNLYCIFSLLLSISFGLKSSDTSIDLQFVIPGSSQLITTKLSMQSHQDVTFYKIIRSVLYMNNIIMDCTFTFDTSNFNKNQPLICDINNACISSSASSSSIKLHLENLGVGDLEILEIKQRNIDTNYEKSLFYDHLICIGDSDKCDGHRYIDFISNPQTQTLEISPINSQIHNKLQCNSKDTHYQHSPQIITAPDQQSEAHNKQTEQETIIGSNRRLLSTDYNSNTYYNHAYHPHHPHNNYMDILLTIVLLIMVVISVYNMSYYFDQYKGNNYHYDTRRV